MFTGGRPELAEQERDDRRALAARRPVGHRGPADGQGTQRNVRQDLLHRHRGGAGGNIGSEYAARSPADGHTLLITSGGPIVINPHVYKKMTYDPQKELIPITNMLRVPLVLAVNPAVPARNLQELIAYIKEQKGGAQWASAGNGTPQHMTGELFRTTARLEMIHVPYKGSAPAITDLVGCHVPMMFDTTIAIMPQIKAGKVRAIAVSGAQRSAQLPDVPTFAEAGLEQLTLVYWNALWVPSGTPEAVRTALVYARATGAKRFHLVAGRAERSDGRASGRLAERAARASRDDAGRAHRLADRRAP